MKLQRGFRTLSVFVLLAAGVVTLSAQAPPTSAKPAQEMKKLDFLVGNWEGEGWMDVNGQRASFTSNEKVQSKLDGTILTIEGLHKSKAAGKEEPRIVHNALAVISYDEPANGYRFSSYLADGRAGVYKGSVQDGTFIWLLEIPRGKMQYKIQLNEKGEWSEVGEYSPDGTSWRKIFEMTLHKVKSAA
jgi:hypothetical protein